MFIVRYIVVVIFYVVIVIDSVVVIGLNVGKYRCCEWWNIKNYNLGI